MKLLQAPATLIKTILLIFLLATPAADSRTWTDLDNRQIEAEIVRASDLEVVVNHRGREVTIRLSTLSEGDRDFVEGWLSDRRTSGTAGDSDTSPPATAPAGGGSLLFDGKTLETGGKRNLFEYPYSAEHLEKISKLRPKQEDTGWKLAIAVPANFDPTKPQRVFIAKNAVNNDQQRLSGNVGAFGMYAPASVASGWVCIAYDSNLGRPYHNFDLEAAMEKLAAEWPGFKSWQFAVGGFSGGAKACFNPLAYLIKNDYDAIGAFLGGCNSVANCAHWKKEYKASNSGYRKVKAFVSTGTNDNLVSKAQVEGVVSTLRSESIRSTRSEFYEGGHSFHRPHFEEALKWFAEP